MGCAHSARSRVDVPTTSDDLVSSTLRNDGQQTENQGRTIYSSNNSERLTVEDNQGAVVTSSANASGNVSRQGSARMPVQQQASQETSGPPLPVGDPRSDPAPVSADGATSAPMADHPDGPPAPGTFPSSASTADASQSAATSRGPAAAAATPSGTLPRGPTRPTGLLPPLQRPSPQPPVPESTEAVAPASLPFLRDMLEAEVSSSQSPPRQPAPGTDDVPMLVLIVWDIENVRCPRGNGRLDPLLTPAKVLGYIKDHFVREPGRVEYRTVAAVTPKSLGVMQRKYPDFVDQVVPDLALLVASADEPKRNADVMLKKELYLFVSQHSHMARRSPGRLTVVLISGDEDFLEPVQVALNSGFSVELMHHDQPSWALRSQQGYAREPLLWADFLRQRSGASHVNLPYNHKKNGKHR